MGHKQCRHIEKKKKIKNWIHRNINHSYDIIHVCQSGIKTVNISIEIFDSKTYNLTKTTIKSVKYDFLVHTWVIKSLYIVDPWPWVMNNPTVLLHS